MMTSSPRDEDILDPHEVKELPMAFVKVIRRRFRLYVFRRPSPFARTYGQQPVFTCTCATGAFGFTTPKGVHMVMSKALNPDWLAPDAKWARDAGYEVGQIIPGGDPANPIKAAWLRITEDGVGIHGTDNLLSLGSRASHGCLRVSPEDALKVFDLVPAGCIVEVV